MLRRAHLLLLLALGGCGLTGCGLAGGGSSTTTVTPAAPARTAPAHTAPARTARAAPPAGSETTTTSTVPAVARSPASVITVFAEGYTNWTARTVSARMQLLADASIGQARRAMALEARRTASDYDLHRGGIANQGQVEAVAPLAGHEHQYVVVTLERTTATNSNAYQGLRPAWHLTLATVTPFRGGWVVSGWQPEN